MTTTIVTLAGLALAFFPALQIIREDIGTSLVNERPVL